MAFKLMQHRFSKNNETIVAGLDIGTSKVCCAVARIESSGDLTVLGYGFYGSRGLRGGMIVDMEALQDAVAHAVHGAEEMAGETIDEVYVSVSPALCHSKAVRVDLPISAHPVDDDDIKKIIQHLRDRGLGVLITDHNVRETLDVCEHSYIVSHGHLIASGTSEEILSNEKVKEVYLGDQFRL